MVVGPKVLHAFEDDPPLYLEFAQLGFEELVEMGHRGRLAHIYRFLDRFPILWAASTRDVAVAVYSDCSHAWADYAIDDPRWPSNTEVPDEAARALREWEESHPLPDGSPRPKTPVDR